MKLDQLKKQMSDLGWTYKGSCNCNKVHNEKFELKNENGEYKIRIRHSNFLINAPGRKSKKLPISELQKTLNEISEKNKATI